MRSAGGDEDCRAEWIEATADVTDDFLPGDGGRGERDEQLPRREAARRRSAGSATLHGYPVAFWWATAIFAVGAVVCDLVLRGGTTTRDTVGIDVPPATTTTPA
jgi:hypothetical protein